MLTDVLRMIGSAKIQGLVTRGLAETQIAQLLTEIGSAPVTFSKGPMGLKVLVKVTLASAFPDVGRYIDLAAQDCGFDIERIDGDLYISAEVQGNSRILDEIRELCRLARLIIDSSTWLMKDQSARTVWAALAHPASHSQKGEV